MSPANVWTNLMSVNKILCPGRHACCSRPYPKPIRARQEYVGGVGGGVAPIRPAFSPSSAVLSILNIRGDLSLSLSLSMPPACQGAHWLVLFLPLPAGQLENLRGKTTGARRKEDKLSRAGQFSKCLPPSFSRTQYILIAFLPA